MLSLVLPLAVNTELLTRRLATGFVIRQIGRFVSKKVAVKVRLEAIVNVSLAALVVWLPVQFMNLQPLVGIAVSEKILPISKSCPLVAPEIVPLPTTRNSNGAAST